MADINARTLRIKLWRLHRQLHELEQLLQPIAVPKDNQRKRDVVTRALLALRQSTLEQRIEVFRELGMEEVLSVLASLETQMLNGASAGQAELHL